MITEGRLRAIRSLCEDQQGDRLAVAALLAAVGGDNLTEAIDRLGAVRESVPERRTGRDLQTKTWNDLTARMGDMLDCAIEDLERLQQLEATDG